MRGYYFLLLLALGGVMMLGCDSQSNIKDPSLTHFIKFYGGDGDQTGVDMVGLSDGTFILFGTSIATSPDSTTQWYLVKTDPFGTVIWEKRFGSQTLNETASDIELTADGRLVAVGNSYKSPTDRDVLIMTFTLDGVPINKAIVALKNLAGAETDEDAVSVSLTSDGFIVAGSTSSTDIKPGPSLANDKRDAMHLRFFNNLIQYDLTWRVTTGPGTYDAAEKVVQVSQTQFYLFGYSNTLVNNQHPKSDLNFWYFGLGEFGEAKGADNFIGTVNDDEKLSSFAVSPAQSGEGYFLGGITYSSSGTADLYIAKLRKSLAFNNTDIQFEKPLSIALGSAVPEHTSVFASQLGGFYVLANEKSLNDNQNWLLTKINNGGSIAWTLPLVFGGEGLDTIGSIQELPDGRIVIIGTMRTGKPDSGELKMTLIKLNSDGKLSD